MICRICGGSAFRPILDLGMTSLADDFLTAERLNAPETRYPLKLQICATCDLVQLTYVAPRELLYGEDYPYVSSTTRTGVAHYREMAATIARRVRVGRIDLGLAVDIGSNVGVLLEGFKQCGMSVLGIEPVPKIAEMANLRGIETVNRFFSERLAHEIVQARGRASVITGTNVVAHIDDLHDLMRGIKALLAPGGMFVFEAPYLGELIDRREYDTIYHEHLSYLAIWPVKCLVEQFGLEVFDVERRAIHGGTMRYYIAARGDYSVQARVREAVNVEQRFTNPSALALFAADVMQQRSDLNFMLRQIKARGERIAAVGAPAKGMTLLNYCKLDAELIDFVTEKAPLKIGRFTPGTHLPVVPDDRLLEEQPEYALLLPWNFADEVMANLKGYRGRFIVPIPSPEIVEVAA